jgi:hypothetical protein
MIGGMATTSAARQLTAILRTGAGPLARALVENGGAMRVSDVAALLERNPHDKAFQAACKRVIEEGYYKFDGQTSARRLVRLHPVAQGADVVLPGPWRRDRPAERALRRPACRAAAGVTPETGW